MAAYQERFERIVQKLRTQGLKITPQRLAILQILAKSEGHPTVDDIHAQVTNDFPTMSLATVYKNVSLLKSLGEVLELGLPNGSNRYDGNKPYPHPHVICIRYHKIIDLELESLADMTQEVERVTQVAIHHHRLDFFGVCSWCRQDNG